MQHLVYGLIDPRTGELRYVGKSSTGMKRPRCHWYPSRRRPKTHLGRWLTGLYGDGGRLPSILILRERETEMAAFSEETSLIALFRGVGFNLTNATDGGEGVSGSVRTCEYRAHQGAMMRATWADPGYRARMRISEDTRQRMRQARLGFRHSPGTRTRMCQIQADPIRRAHFRAIRLGHPVSNETREKLRRANLGKIPSTATRKKRSLALKGRIVSAETREKLRHSSLGRIFSAASREKMRRSRLAFVATNVPKERRVTQCQ